MVTLDNTCRSFLAPYKDEKGNYKFYGRFNQGVITLNLFDVALSSNGDIDKFWQLMEERTELCHKALLYRHKRLEGTLSDVAPILWQDGAFARLEQHEPIDKLLHGGYSSISLGYAGLYECVKFIKNESHIGTKNGHDFGIEVMKFLDEIDEVAGLIGAVNTIDFKNLKGYNTDGIGAVRAIEEVTSIKNKNVVVAGAGGASRAISFYLAKYGAESMAILNRNVEKAQGLAADVSQSGLIGEVKADSISEIRNYLKDADILVDTTPIGMHPNISDEPIAFAEDMDEDLVVFDAVYNPNETVLLKEAIKAGANPVYGIKMLLYQGAESIKIWTGRDAPVDVMEKALKDTLNLE